MTSKRFTLSRALACAGVVCAGLAWPGAAGAVGPHEAPIKAFAEGEIRSWITRPDVISAIKKQNAKHAKITQAKIKSLDKQWRAETSRSERPLIDEVLSNQLSRFLKEMKKAQRGIVTEVFIMDNKGLNVGQSDVTSDFWQGDEAKWKKTYKVGPDAMLVDEIELDESTQTFQSQVSMTITDKRGRVIGAITVGIDVEEIIWANLESLAQ